MEQTEQTKQMTEMTESPRHPKHPVSFAAYFTLLLGFLLCLSGGSYVAAQGGGFIAKPSPGGSPVASGKPDVPTTNGQGVQWVKVVGNVSTSASGGGTQDVTWSSPMPVSVPSPVNVRLPSASPVPVQGMLPAGSPVGSLASLPVTLTPGWSSVCSPSFAGGSSEATAASRAGSLVEAHISNPNTSDVYWEAWDASNPTPGTTAPDLCYLVPAGLGASNRGWCDVVLPNPGWTFGTALTHTVVTAANGSSTPTSPVTVTLVIR